MSEDKESSVKCAMEELRKNMAIVWDTSVKASKAKQFCEDIGCSGVFPHMCNNRPLDCGIVQKIFGKAMGE